MLILHVHADAHMALDYLFFTFWLHKHFTLRIINIFLQLKRLPGIYLPQRAQPSWTMDSKAKRQTRQSCKFASAATAKDAVKEKQATPMTDNYNNHNNKYGYDNMSLYRNQKWRALDRHYFSCYNQHCPDPGTHHTPSYPWKETTIKLQPAWVCLRCAPWFP